MQKGKGRDQPNKKLPGNKKQREDLKTRKTTINVLNSPWLVKKNSVKRTKNRAIDLRMFTQAHRGFLLPHQIQCQPSMISGLL